MYLCTTMNIHVFNPEHDIALAANSKFWTAPHAGRQLRADLGWLPSLWAEDGDLVIVNDVSQAQNAVRKLNRSVASVTFVTLEMLKRFGIGERDDVQVMPWGWDVSIVEQLARAGVSRRLMPADDTLSRQRELSGRATASRLLQEICGKFDTCIGEAKAVSSVDELKALMTEWGRVVLKSPWSSSGRGVRYIDDRPHNIIMWADKVMRTQGYLMVERYQEKVVDFGMEFCVAEDGSVRYEGLSLFDTTAGAYTGGVLATESEKSESIERYLPNSLLSDVQMFICAWMQKEINGSYVGPFGVDMMVCKSEDGMLMLDPCVEINLRRTMGHVALYLSPKQEGNRLLMRIGYEGTNYHFRIVNDHELLF